MSYGHRPYASAPYAGYLAAAAAAVIALVMHYYRRLRGA